MQYVLVFISLCIAGVRFDGNSPGLDKKKANKKKGVSIYSLKLISYKITIEIYLVTLLQTKVSVLIINIIC